MKRIKLDVVNCFGKVTHMEVMPALRLAYITERFSIKQYGGRLIAKPLNIKQMKQNKGV